MIYYSFKNYDEFKDLFGIVEHGNGVKSRKNKILLSLFKQREVLHLFANPKVQVEESGFWAENRKTGKEERCTRWSSNIYYPFDVNLLSAYSIGRLRDLLYAAMSSVPFDYYLSLNGHTFKSNVFETDDFNGVCEDGDEQAVRYVNHERGDRVFKMKAGKFFRKLVEENHELDALLSEQVKIWLCEQFAEEWKAYAATMVRDDYELHVDDNFADIYDSYYLDGNFSSCMVGHCYHDFYSKAVNAKAAYLTHKDEHGNANSIVARCIIFPEVHVNGSDKVLRLAERQYATDGSDKLKRQLVMALIEAGEIDGYKRIGAECSDSRGFVDIHGNSLESTDFWIDCKINDCSVSYQDSFKYYDEDTCRAWNSNYHSYSHNLATTDGYIEEDHEDDDWSEYNQEYIPSDESYYVEIRDDYFWGNQVREAHMWLDSRGCFSRCTDYCFENDCIKIDGEYYYGGDNCNEMNGIGTCPQCGKYFLYEYGYYSELTEEDYCCEDCMNEAEERWHEDNGDVQAEWDGEWHDADDVVSAKWWTNVWTAQGYVWSYCDTTISVDDLNELIDNGEATYLNGVFYIDDILCDGEPAHMCAAALKAA